MQARQAGEADLDTLVEYCYNIAKARVATLHA